ncbi:hypothetical protein [Bacteriophage sp.]|nr:hypothetical protein [Bacteriophage sp.]
MQTRLLSAVETVTSTGVGFALSLGVAHLTFPLFGFQSSVKSEFWITCIFTIVSLLRGYVLRRLFNWITYHALPADRTSTSQNHDRRGVSWGD